MAIRLYLILVIFLISFKISLADEIRAKYLPPSNALNAPPSSNGEIPYKDYRAVANLTGAELGSDHQNRAMAIQAQRIAKLRRGY